MQSTDDGLASVALRVVAQYGLAPRQVIRRDKGYRNHSFAVLLRDNRLVNLIIYKQEPGIAETIRRSDTVSDFVAERGIPARHSLDDRIVRISYAAGNRYARLYDYLPGETIAWEAYTRGHLVALGTTLAKLHALLETYNPTPLPNIEDVLLGATHKMLCYFQDPGVLTASKTTLGVLCDRQRLTLYAALLEQCKSLSGRQALHMDFVRGNILFDGTKDDGIPVISGVLDFEKAAVGHRLFDVARTLAFLLVDTKYKTSEQTTKYFLRSGYVKRGGNRIPAIPVRLTDQNHDLLALLLDFFLLHDFYKFLRHNPYQSLAHNEHYLRTRDILLDRSLLAKA